MKSIKLRLVGLFCTALLIGSCTNLDENLKDQWTSKNFPYTTDELNAAVVAAYSPLYSWNNHGNYFSMQEVSTDEAMIPQRGGDWYDGGQPAGIHTHAYASNYDFVNNLYNSAFGGVSACNRIMTLKSVTSNATLTAELKVLRAYYYWVLLDNYGNIPLSTEFGVSQGQKTRIEIYNFIDSELTTNLPILKAATTAPVPVTPTNSYARINYWTGQAIAAKFYLNAAIYSGASQNDKTIAACDAIINS